MSNIKDFLPLYREINTIVSKVIDDRDISFPEQCTLTNFYNSHKDEKAFEQMILDIVIAGDEQKWFFLLNHIQIEAEKYIGLYESGKDILDGIDINGLCMGVSSRFDELIKRQSEVTAEARKELNTVNGSLEAIGFREHTKEEEQRLEREHDYLTKIHNEEKDKLESLYDEKRKLELEVAKYSRNIFADIYGLSQSFLAIVENYIPIPLKEKMPETESISEPQPQLLTEINPDNIFRLKMYNKFLELERRLIKDCDLDKNLHWIAKHKNGKPDIKRLVTLLTALEENKYFIPGRDSRIKAFFESRYNITIGQNFEKKRREPLKSEYNAVFYEYPF